MVDKPKQIHPLLSPTEPISETRYPYYLLEEMHSPPVSTPNAIRWEAYDRPRYFLRQDDPNDNRVAYGFIEYEKRLSWAELKKYNMLPFDYDESVLYDLWRVFNEDGAKMLAFFVLFFRITRRDPGLRRLGLAVKLVSREWTLRKVRAFLNEIPILTVDTLASPGLPPAAPGGTGAKKQ